MNIDTYLDVLKSIQINILQFIDMEDNVEENYENIIKIFNDQKILENYHEIKLIINLISGISYNHRRSSDFFSKIEKLLLYFKNEIQKIYTNEEIYRIFEDNKRILLFLIKEKVLIFDQNIYKKLNVYSTKKYFYPEIKSYEEEQKNNSKEEDDDIDNNNKKSEKKEENSDKKENFSSDDFFENDFNSDSSDTFDDQQESYEYEYSDDIFNSQSLQMKELENKKSDENEGSKNAFRDLEYLNLFRKSLKPEKPLEINEEKRMIGENDNELCEIIRKDDIEEFIIYVNKNEISLQSHIEESIYETNILLMNSYSITLIKYAAFFGSIQIFKYLYLNGVELESSLWIYAIHGDNEEMIHILEEKEIKPSKKSFTNCFNESVKCYHNGIAKYIEENYISDEIKNYYCVKFLCYSHYNFELIYSNKIDNDSMYPLIEFDYYTLIKLIIENNYIDINKYIICTISDYNKYNKTKNTYKLECQATPLIFAIEKKDIDLIKLILSHSNIDVNINKIEKYSMFSYDHHKLDFDYIKEKSPLYIAFKLENMEIIQLLLANPNIDVNNKYIKKKITGPIVDNKIDYDDNKTNITIVRKFSLLNIAISKNDLEFVKLLLENENIDVNSEELIYDSIDSKITYTPLMKATNQFFNEIAMLLLSNPKIDVNCKLTKIKDNQLITDKTVLFVAVEFSNIEIVEILVSNPNIEVNTIITTVTDNDNIISKRTALYQAVKVKLVEIVDLLLKVPNIDVNIKTINKQKCMNYQSEKTALFYAVKHKNIEIVKSLLSNQNIDVNIETIKRMNNDAFLVKKSILYEAVENKNIDIIKLLLSNPNIDVNYRSLRNNKFKKIGSKKAEKTVLYKAIELNNVDIVKLLLSKQNIDVNQKSYKYLTLNDEKDGEYIKIKTPLHAAVLIKNIEIITLLLNCQKIDINVEDDQGKKPFELTNDDKISALIKEH